MSLDTDAVTDFKSDANMPNIWTIADEDGQTSGSVTQPTDDDFNSPEPDMEPKDNHQDSLGASSHDEAELEKPSFLRRLTQRRREHEGDDDKLI